MRKVIKPIVRDYSPDSATFVWSIIMDLDISKTLVDNVPCSWWLLVFYKDLLKFQYEDIILFKIDQLGQKLIEYQRKTPNILVTPKTYKNRLKT